VKTLEITAIFKGVVQIFRTHKHGCRKWERNSKISAKRLFS